MKLKGLGARHVQRLDSVTGLVLYKVYAPETHT